MSRLVVERLDIVISSTLIVVVEGGSLVVRIIEVGDGESIDVIDLDHPKRSFPKEILCRTIAKCTEEYKLLDRVSLSKSLGSDLLVDLEEGIAHEVDILQRLSF